MIEMTKHLENQHHKPNILDVRAFSNLHKNSVEEQCGYHGKQWPKPIFTSPLHVPKKFGGRRSINSREEGCENFPMFSW